jgi:hypothetical protein
VVAYAVDGDLQSPATKVRRWFEGTGPFPILAVIMAAVGTMFLVLTLSSIGGLVWTGTAVKGNEQGGLVYYTYKGHVYTVDDLNSYRTGPRTVYVDPGNPGRAVLNTPVSGGIQLATVGGPYLIAAGFVVWSVRRKRFYLKRRREANELGGDAKFGLGLDDHTMQRLLDRQRSSGQGRTGSG